MKIMAFSDSHLGYTSGDKIHPQSGLNHRVRDGYIALRRTVDLAIEHQADLVVQCGDIFHRSWPTVGDIAFAQTELRRLSKAGIPVLLNTGNHDASNDRSKSPATLALHDPDRGIHVTTALTEVHRPVPGLAVHVLSHMGLAARERQEVKPVDGEVNIFTAHGAAAVPGHEIFHCIDSPGEQPIGLDLLGDPGWAAVLLGHYHGMGPLPGLPHAWYAGSSLRRGFSDPEGGRGALMVTVDASGSVAIDRMFIPQRPQHDLPVVDASGLTGAEVEELVRMNLESVGLDGAIVRQVVVNCPLSVKRGVDSAALRKIAASALVWQPDYRRPDAPDPVRPGDPVPANHDSAEPADPAAQTRGGFAAAGAARLPQMWREWAPGWQPDLPDKTRKAVVDQGEKHLVAVSRTAETGDDADPLAMPGDPKETAQ